MLYWFHLFLIMCALSFTGCDNSRIRVESEDSNNAATAANKRSGTERKNGNGREENGKPSTRIRAISSPTRTNGKQSLDRNSLDRNSLENRETYSLTGTVRNTSGSAVANAAISVIDSPLSATTNAAGVYELRELRSATIAELSVSHADYESTMTANVATDAGPVDFVMQPRQTSTLIGVVLNWSARTPVADFEVAAENKTIRKLEPGTGRFEITNAFEHEQLRVAISAAGFATQSFLVRMPPRQPQPFQQTFIIGPGSSVRGRVLDMFTRAPLAGVPVSLSVTQREANEAPTSITVVTDSAGAFAAEKVPPGLVRVKVQPLPPLAPVSDRAILSHNGNHDFGELLVGAFGTVEGKLLKVPGNQGVEGERVSMAGESAWPQPVTTLADGTFRFTGLSPGRYTVSVQERRLYEAITVQSGQIHDVTFRIGSATLNGLVLKNGNPFTAYVQFSRESGGQVVTSARADNEGRFTVEGLSPGYYEAVIFQSNERGQAQRSKQSFTMPESGSYDHTFHIPGGAIVGKVVGKDDNPIPGALVLMLVDDPGIAYQSVPIPTISTTSQADGSFRIENMDAGTHWMTARLQNLGSAEPTKVTVPPGGKDANITLRIDPSKTGTLVSTALNFADGSPIPSAWCLLSTPHGRMGHGQQRGGDGIMRIPHLPAGEYKVQVSANAFSVAEQTITIRAGETTEITDVLHETGALRWTVVDENGAGIANVNCTLTPADNTSIEQPRQGITDQSGLWAVRGLVPGVYTMTGSLAGRKSINKPVTITPRQLTVETATMY